MRGLSLKEQIGGIVFPVLLYFILSMLVPGILGMVWNGFLAEEYSVWLLAFSNMLMIPVFLPLYRQDCMRREFRRNGKEGDREGIRKRKMLSAGDFLLVVLTSVLLSRGLNYLIALTPLPSLFTGYEAVTESLYESSLPAQIAASVLSAAFLEELLMRGILYGRLRDRMPDWRMAGLGSALIFALFHGNAVQGAYAFGLGFFFAWAYEVYGTLRVPIAAHMAANAVSVLAERHGLSDVTEGLRPESAAALYYLIPCVCLTAAFFLIKYMRRKSEYGNKKSPGFR